MAISINPSTLVITVQQVDCVFVSGTFYRLPTETVFRAAMNDLLDDETGVYLPTAISHNTEVTVAGVTYARFIELINGYSVQFTPDSQWTVELIESNSNLHDVASGALVQNQVQVITTNAAGLIVRSGTTSGLTPTESAQLDAINTTTVTLRKLQMNKMITDPITGLLTIYDDDDTTVLYSGNIYEDALAAQLYQGSGLERRERLT